jgi:hypothetical protein
MTDEDFWREHPGRQLRLRKATHDEAAGTRPLRPDVVSWAIVDRRGKVTVFHATGAFNPPGCDAMIASLLSDLMTRVYTPRVSVAA